MDSLSVIQILYREFTKHQQSFSRINFEFTIYFEKLLWSHCLFCEFTINQLSILQIHNEFTINQLSILQIHNEYTICFEISLFINNSFREFTICIGNSLYINNHLRGFGLNQLSVSRIYYWFREFNFNLLSLKRFYHVFWLIHALHNHEGMLTKQKNYSVIILR